MKPTKTPQEKFKAGLKKSGYDPDAGAKRLLDLIAKQKKEREEFESKYKSAYEGREMKTLKQIIEGTVVMSDFKLDKRGRKYKAHRSTMGRGAEMTEGLADDAFAELDAEVEKSKSGKKSMDQANSLDRDVDKFRERVKSGQAGKSTKLSDMNPLDREQWEKSKKAAGIEEDVEQVDEVSKETVSGYNKKAMAYIKNYKYSNNPPSVRRKLENRFSGVERADERLKGSKPTSEAVEMTEALKSPGQKQDFQRMMSGAMSRKEYNAKYPKTADPTKKLDSTGVYKNLIKTTKEEVEQVDELKKSTLASYVSKAVTDVHNQAYRSGEAWNDAMTRTGNYKKALPTLAKSMNRQSGIRKAVGKMANEELEQVDEISKGSIEKYMNSAVPDYGHQNLISRVGKGSDKEEATRKLANRSRGITRAVMKTTEKNMKEEQELDEARGRPPSAATLAKRAAAAAKPQHDDDEGEHYDADSGVEADQHIHVQLKKAADSDQKPFEVSFRNGKKHKVSQKVAKDILSATERLKPEHRKNVHDEIHQSYDNLMSVHRLVAGR
jgi:hypothetical protein